MAIFSHELRDIYPVLDISKLFFLWDTFYTYMYMNAIEQL